VVVVAVVGVVVHAPLSRVPENTLKFAVGVMLTSFGIFWGAEGAGASWPGNDAALLVLVPVVVLVALGYTALLRHTRVLARAGVKGVARGAAGCVGSGRSGPTSSSATTGAGRQPLRWPWPPPPCSSTSRG